MNNIAENFEYSIGVVTYVARFEEFFKPLIKQLTQVFPDREIVCIINGHPDSNLQAGYLKHVTAFLANYPNVRYLTNEKHQSLAKCFNWLLMMSFAPRMLILNDDISLNLLFRKDFEKALLKYPDFFIINQSWSHVLISKEVVKKVGWFEERLVGTGQEDADYGFRMKEAGFNLNQTKCYGVINYVAPQKNAGWKEFSEVSKSGGKSSEINDQFFYKKYSKPEVTSSGEPKLHLNPGMETPEFYDRKNLEESSVFPKPEFSFKNRRARGYLNLLVPVYWAYSFTRKTGGKVYRYLRKFV